MYEFDIVRFVPVLVRTSATSEEETDLVAAVDAMHDEEWVLDVAAIEADVALGACIVWFSGTRARVRIDDCLSHLATDPDARDDDRSSASFRDDDGSTFSVPMGQALARDRAVEALRYWLRTGARWSELAWT